MGGPATVKVIAFPLRLGRRWAFQALPRSRGQESGGGPGSQASSTTMMKQLLNRLVQAPPRVSDRMKIAISFAEEQMQSKWMELEGAKPGSIRHRVYSLGRKLLAKLEPSEQFFKSIPEETTTVNIVHPTSVNSRLARRRLRHLATSGTVFHKRLLYGSLALLPVSALFAIVPMPNIIMAWNLFRAHAHWRALQGSRRLEQLVTEKASGSSKVSCSCEFTPSDKLEKLVSIANASVEPLSNEKIEAICKEYQLDTVDVTKWRDHRSKYLKLAWA